MICYAFLFVSAALLQHVHTQTCPVQIADSARRDCYSWDGASQATCEARGCVWCPHGTNGVPWCFYNDEVCPSSVPEAARVDCHPEPDSNRDSCLSRGCIWCRSDTDGIPWCFVDSSVSMGGQRCPAEIPDAERVDCFPSDGATIDLCVARGCFWCSTAMSGAPWCFTPRQHGYRMTGNPVATNKGYRVGLRRVNTPSWYGADMATVNVDVEFQESYRLRVKIYDPNAVRYEVPISIPSPDRVAPNALYDIVFVDEPAFHFKVVRKSSGVVLFDTSLGGLQFSDQFIQIAAKLPSTNVYGFGETEHYNFKHDMNWKKWGMWARDEPVKNWNLYGAHPFFTALDTNGNMFGTLFLNSNGQEVELMPSPGLTYRTIGGVLDMYFFLGPQPENVISQYTEAIGRPTMPPYWALGFQLSKYGYNTLDNMKAAINRMRAADIPLDVQHGDIDYFERYLDFTYDQVRFAGMPDYIRQLKREGTRFITLLDPFIGIGEPPGTYPPFERGQALNIWVKESDGQTNAESKVWPESNVYYPDYSKPSCQQWWNEQTSAFHNTIEFDALWVDMNEPASFPHGSVKGCSNNKWNFPPFKPRSLMGEILFEKTICTDYMTGQGRHYDTHSLYGKMSAQATVGAVRASTGGKRSLVISRSSFPGSGSYSGRWLGDNMAEWDDLRHSIIGVLEFNMFGIPYIGADICGFFGDSYPALCSRWMQLGAFYPFSRNHNGAIQDQDPGYWPEVAAVSRDVLHIRYTLLPYFYTIFHQAHTNGNTVFRPLMHEFNMDANTYDVDEQFLWGPTFMITPVVYENAVTVRGYFPDARWYRYRDGVLENHRAVFAVVDAPTDFIPLHVRGGYVLPTQAPANSTMFSRSNPMGLIVALDDNGAASGTLFWDEGDTPDTYETGAYFLGGYTVSQRSLQATVEHSGYVGAQSLRFNTVQVWGLSGAPPQVTVDGTAWPNFTFDDITKVLKITGLDLTVTSPFNIQW